MGGILILILFGILFTTDIYKIEIKMKGLNLLTGITITVPLIFAGVLLVKLTPWNIVSARI